MESVKTENSYFEEKVLLRLRFLPEGQDPVRVLDCFSADGKLWEAIKARTQQRIQVLRIEKLPDKKGIYLKGDNLK